jgi:hypothetical protein
VAASSGVRASSIIPVDISNNKDNTVEKGESLVVTIHCTLHADLPHRCIQFILQSEEAGSQIEAD